MGNTELYVIKRNGTKVPFDESKIRNAIAKAVAATKDATLTESSLTRCVGHVAWEAAHLPEEELTVENIQNVVETELMREDPATAKSYILYRHDRSIQRHLLPANKADISGATIRKKDGSIEAYNEKKLLAAVSKSAFRARNSELDEEERDIFLSLMAADIAKRSGSAIPTSVVHTLVEANLQVVAGDVAKAYSNYHSYKMEQSEIWEEINGKCSVLTYSGDDSEDEEVLTQKNQNANADASLASTTKAFFGDYTSEAYYDRNFLTKAEKEASRDGYIYVHDRGGRSIYPFNCCLLRADVVMEQGAVVNGVPYNKPTNLKKAFGVLGDIILISASQQYGGLTIPRVDSLMVQYAQMTYDAAKSKYLGLGLEEETADQLAYNEVKEDMYDGFQQLEIKLNTVASSRGDYPFTTITFGLDTSRWGRLASIAALDTRRKGQGKKGKKKPVLFPKLVFLYDENLHGPGKELEEVFEAGLKCSAKTMYPDWLSLTGEGYVPSMYKKYGVKGVVSPMGCRAFLSPWYERGGFEPADENDVPVFEGRFNIGVFSLHLPMILAKARKEEKDFYEVLDYYMEMIRGLHKRTYEYLSHLKAAKNPVGFCYGGFYGGNLAPDDTIEPVLKYSTASFGITALNELQELYNGKSLVEDGEFALEVMKYINDKIQQFKKEDHVLYAIYGTPAENLCGKQIKQFRDKYGIIKGVSDREYVSNSFHCHVTENITPIQKQDLEKRFWDYFNGGKIQYCRYNLGYNVDAIRTLVNRAMKMGFYEGVNLSLDFCDDCGYEQVEMGVRCPKCGGVHITQIDRMNGYLGFTRIGSDARVEKDANGNEYIMIHSRYSPHKQKEIKDRISM